NHGAAARPVRRAGLPEPRRRRIASIRSRPGRHGSACERPARLGARRELLDNRDMVGAWLHFALVLPRPAALIDSGQFGMRSELAWIVRCSFWLAGAGLSALPSFAMTAAPPTQIQFTGFASAAGLAAGGFSATQLDANQVVLAPGALSGTWVSPRVKPHSSFTRLVA